MEVELERLEGLLSKGEEVDLDLYNRMTGTLARVIDRLGLKRAARDVTIDLKEYIAAHAKREAAE